MPYTQSDHDRAVEQGGLALLAAAIALIVAAIAALVC